MPWGSAGEVVEGVEGVEGGIALNALERLCSKETCAEIVRAVTGKQLEVIAWRWEGLTCAEIGEIVGVTPSAVSHRLREARWRIAQAVPEVMGDVLAREQPRRPRKLRSERKCVDCGKPISEAATRCRLCANRIPGKNGRGKG